MKHPSNLFESLLEGPGNASNAVTSTLFFHPLFFCRKSIFADSTGFERGQCDIGNVSGMIKPSQLDVRASHFGQIKSGAQLGVKYNFD